MSNSKKKKVIFIAPYPKGKAPSQRFRFEQYLDYLTANNLDIEVLSFLSEKGWNTIYKKGSVIAKVFEVLKSFGSRFYQLPKIAKADYLFIHREASHIGPPIFEWIIAKVLKKKFIYDFDDAIWLPNFSEQNARFQVLKNYKKVKRIMKWADKITAGNEYLLEFAWQYNKNVLVIPTTIDTVNHHNLTTNYNAKPITMGWTGSHTTAQYLHFLEPILQRLEAKFDFKFRVISNEKPDLKLKSLEYIPWNKDTEIKDLSAINIGVMPLKDDIWAKGKCGFKALQYMALGIPSVVSPVGVNTTIIKNGVNGYLCSNEADWESTLSKLLSSTDDRKRIGSAGKKTLEQSYSVNAMRNKYLNLFK